MQKPFVIKPCFITTTPPSPAVSADLERWLKVARKMPFAQVLDFKVEVLPMSDAKPQVFLDYEDDKVRIKHSWFYENITKRVLAHSNLIFYHFTRAERKALGLDENVNGTYWYDKNHYLESWICADEGEMPSRHRTRFAFIDGEETLAAQISQLLRLLFHEGGHGVVHFSGMKEVLNLKYNTDDVVHHLDYEEKNVSKIYELVTFERWSMSKYAISLLQQLIGLLKKQKAMVERETEPTAPVHRSRILDWASAIEKFEDYVEPGQKYRDGRVAAEGSLSYRNRNPGNLRWSIYEAGNRGGFSYFNTYEEGKKALIHQLTIAADGRSSSYKSSMTLRQFFDVYAPSSDNNFPAMYARFVADYMGVSVETVIKDLI